MAGYINDSVIRSMSTVLQLTMILIPLMIVMEYANRYQLLEKLTEYLGWLPKSLAMSPEASFPLVVGLCVGVTYGAAVIIEYTRQGSLSKRDTLLCGTFLAINHSMIEDNLIMAALGANLVVLFVLRFIMAFLVTRVLSLYLDRKKAAGHTIS